MFKMSGAIKNKLWKCILMAILKSEFYKSNCKYIYEECDYQFRMIYKCIPSLNVDRVIFWSYEYDKK